MDKECGREDELGGEERTFEGRKAAIEDQFEIAELALCERNRRQSLSFCGKLYLARQVSRKEILQDSAMW
jgi:hypothetical protein